MQSVYGREAISTVDAMLILDVLHRAGLSQLEILLAVRLSVFIALFAILPLPLLPRIARIALGVALFAFLLPLAESDKGRAPDFGGFVVGIGGADLRPVGITYAQLLFHSALGVALAVSLSAGAYAAEALASWCGALLGMWPTGLRESLAYTFERSPQKIIMLLYLAVLTPSLPLLFPLLAESVLQVAPLRVDSGVVGITAGIVAGTARVALLGALLGAVPLFLVALTADLFSGAAMRVFPGCVSVGLTRAVRVLAVVGGVSLVSVGTERALAAVLDGGLMEGRGAATAAQLQPFLPGGIP